MMDWLRDHWWAAWLILSLALASLELLSTDLILIMLAGGALVGCVAALFGAPFALQLVLALATSVGLLAVVRPGAIRRLHAGPDLRTGTDALVGRQVRVTDEITPEHPGRVKIGGEHWAAVSYDEDAVIAVGAKVDVVMIKGATAYVLAVPELSGGPADAPTDAPAGD